MILSQLSADVVAAHFSAQTMARARAYARDGSTSSPDIQRLTETEVEAVAFVAGSGQATYVVHLRAADRAGRLTVATSCSCPVGYQCKHGAALALVLGAAFQPAHAAAGWEHSLGQLVSGLEELAPSPTELPGVALAFTHTVARSAHRYVPRGTELRLRPMRPGAKQAWVKSGLDWSDIASSRTQHRYDAAQLEVLTELADALAARRTYWTSDEPAVQEFGPTLVPLLGRAVEAGITLLPVPPLTQISLHGEPLELVLDVSADHAGTVITSGLAHDDRLWHGDDLLVWGDPAHSAALLDGGRLVLGRLARRLPAGPVGVLRSGRPVTIPSEVDAEDHLRRLMRLSTLTSSDASVELPEPVLPRLRLTVTWASSQEASLSWSWLYGEDAVLDADTHALRDRAAERRLLDRLPQRPDLSPRSVTGVDVLHLALLELPAWRAAEEVEVVEVDAPDFREAEAGPEISFDVPDNPVEHTTATSEHQDWLDLEVVITVEGERVALAEALAAITLGHEFLVLPSGLFVRTDRPEFEKLADVVRAAAELHDRSEDDDRVKVGRHDLGLWAQLAELGVVDEQAATWVRRAQALRDLVDLPRPAPSGIVSTLRSYQLDGFHWLTFLWEHRLGGILADDMGLGKTLQVLTLIAHTRAVTDRPFLVVAPTSVVTAWEEQAARHAPDLRVRTIEGSRRRRTETIADLAADADIVVTSYTLLRLESDDYAAVTWEGLVLDEAQMVKNHQSKAYTAARRVPAGFRLAVTGTPFENRLLELWSLLSIVAPGLYPHPRSFTQHVVRPVEKEGDTAALRRFTQRIKPFVLRRTKELVAADLPPKQEQVLHIELNAKHRKIYDTHLAKERQRILGLVDDDFDRNRVAILAALTTLRQLALDPALTDPDHDRVGSAKLDLLAEHLAEITAEGHRALVFSTFTGFLRRVRDRLDADGISTAYLDGSTRDRASVIEEFRSGDASVFLISLKAGGVGLTLTEADYVFVLDPWWNPAAEAQAVDRAHRIGQDKTVMVYRLVSTDTVEDKVLALQARKAALFAQVIDGEGAMSRAIDAADIRALFD